MSIRLSGAATPCATTLLCSSRGVLIRALQICGYMDIIFNTNLDKNTHATNPCLGTITTPTLDGQLLLGFIKWAFSRIETTIRRSAWKHMCELKPLRFAKRRNTPGEMSHPNRCVTTPRMSPDVSPPNLSPPTTDVSPLWLVILPMDVTPTDIPPPPLTSCHPSPLPRTCQPLPVLCTFGAKYLVLVSRKKCKQDFYFLNNSLIIWHSVMNYFLESCSATQEQIGEYFTRNTC